MANARESDEDKVNALSRRLFEMCRTLDNQKLQLVDALPMWVHTSHASPMIQAMAHVDSAVRILEKHYAEVTKAVMALEVARRRKE